MQDETYVLLYANSSWYLFIRLYHMFCQRLRDIRRIANALQREAGGSLESACEQFIYYVGFLQWGAHTGFTNKALFTTTTVIVSFVSVLYLLLSFPTKFPIPTVSSWPHGAISDRRLSTGRQLRSPQATVG